MAKKVVHFKKDCISCGACAALAPEFWELDEEGLARLLGSSEIDDHWERMVESAEDIEKNEEAAQCCPVNIIHLKDD